jgi:hypothetical protein
MVSELDKLQFASTKIGYGNPKGDYWFIGPEEGGSIEGNKDRIQVWIELGSNEHFHDMKDFHLSLSKREGYEELQRFFSAKVKLQSTWNGIMKILFPLLSEKDKTLEKRRNYQKDFLGRKNGATVIAELFPFSSKSLADKKSKDFLTKSKEQYWNDYGHLRESLLCDQILKYRPKVVCFYSTSFNENWQRIIEKLNPSFQNFESIGDLPMKYFKNNETVFIIIPHPIARSMNRKHEQIGLAIKELIE